MDLEVVNVSKKIGTQRILTKVNLKVKSGDIHWIIGEQGTGKTSLIRTLLNIYKPTEGYVYFDGVEANERLFIEKRKKMAYIPQGMSFDEDLTIYENLLFFDGIYFPHASIGNRLKRINRTLSELTLIDQRRKSIKELSPVDLSRMRLAQMLHFDHTLVIVDEPYHLFDMREKEILLASLKRFKEMGTTVLLTSSPVKEVAFKAWEKMSRLKVGGIIE